MDSIHISTDNHHLQQTDTHKILGLKIQQHVSWKSQTNEMCKKANKRMGFSVCDKTRACQKIAFCVCLILSLAPPSITHRPPGHQALRTGNLLDRSVPAQSHKIFSKANHSINIESLTDRRQQQHIFVNRLVSRSGPSHSSSYSKLLAAWQFGDVHARLNPSDISYPRTNVGSC